MIFDCVVYHKFYHFILTLSETANSLLRLFQVLRQYHKFYNLHSLVVHIVIKDKNFFKQFIIIAVSYTHLSGRRRPVPIEGSEEVIDVDTVVVAIGQTPNPLIRKTTKGLDTNKRGCIIADEETGKTSKDHVYAGGDVVTGAATVILAMGAGKAAAAAIDEELSK